MKKSTLAVAALVVFGAGLLGTMQKGNAKDKKMRSMEPDGGRVMGVLSDGSSVTVRSENDLKYIVVKDNQGKESHYNIPTTATPLTIVVKDSILSFDTYTGKAHLIEPATDGGQSTTRVINVMTGKDEGVGGAGDPNTMPGGAGDPNTMPIGK